MQSEYLHGFLLQAGLITAMGPQNLFVLSNAIRGDQAMRIAAACIVCDAALIVLAALVCPEALGSSAWLVFPLRLFGIFVIAVYAAKRFASAARLRRTRPSEPPDGGARGGGVTEAVCMSLLNPHVYLDAIGIIGIAAVNLPGAARNSFIAGAITGSVVWFFGLALGGRLLGRSKALHQQGALIDLLSGVLLAFAAVRLCFDGS